MVVMFKDDRIRVTAVENSHYSVIPPNDRSRMKSYSYRIETPHGIVVFTGDAGPSDGVALAVEPLLQRRGAVVFQCGPQPCNADDERQHHFL